MMGMEREDKGQGIIGLVGISNVFEDAELVKKYRLDPVGILLGVTCHHTNHQQEQGSKFRNEADHNTGVWYSPPGKMQLCSGNNLGFSQQVISQVIGQTLDALVTPAFMTRFIKFLTSQRNWKEYRF